MFEIENSKWNPRGYNLPAMSLPARPDSSYSNIRLTRSNYSPPGHLLSTFNKGKDNGEADAQQSRMERSEPAIDDAPIGSSDEEEEAGDEKELDSDIDFGDTGKRKWSRGDNPTGNGGNGSELESSQGKRARPSSSMESDGEDDKSDLFDLWGSSQQSKRRKSSQFGNRSRSFNKPPSLSTPSSSQNSKPEPKSKKGKKNKKSEFKMPRDIDVSSPPRKTRASKSSALKNPPLPGDLGDILSEDDGSPLSSPDDSCSTPSSIFDLASSQTKPSLCPMCKEEVDPEALTKFQVQTKSLFRDQMAFCDSHQAATAENERKSKGYPIVDWDTFDERVKNHFDDLEKLLVPGSSSYYRDILDSDLKTGKAKNFRLTLSGGGLENISCGYYGTRGSGKM